MLDCKRWLKEKKPGQDAKQGQLKRQKTQKPGLLLKPDRGEQPTMGLKAGKSKREGCGKPGSAMASPATRKVGAMGYIFWWLKRSQKAGVPGKISQIGKGNVKW